MPSPSSGETRDDFIKRCMADPEANSSFPESGQRFAFCNAQFDRKDKALEKVHFTSSEKILKVNVDKRLVYGWASVIEKNGQEVVDSQGDAIQEDNLVKAAHDFILDARAGKLMHQGKRVADVVESLVFTKELQDALTKDAQEINHAGVDLGKIGWFFAMKIRDENLWERVKAGDFPAFSIGGLGRRVPADA